MSLIENDDGARFAERYNGARGAYRVTFGLKPLLVGTMVTHFLLAVTAGALFSWGRPEAAYINFLIAALWGIPITALGFIVALFLGLLLRPVAHQGWHIAAFFTVFTFIPAGITLIISGGDPAGLPVALIIGTAAAVGRASVWKLVEIHPRRHETQPSASE